MNTPRVIRCAVCGESKTSIPGWYQLIENRWTDRLKILRFHESLSGHPNTFAVCCPAHVRELVVHWMTIGRLDLPFARVPSSTRRLFFRRAPQANHELPEPSLLPSTFLGELAVHRESLTRCAEIRRLSRLSSKP